MEQFLYNSRAVIINPQGEEKELKSFSATISESLSAKISSLDLQAEFFDIADIEKFSVGSTVNIYSAPKGQNFRQIGSFFIRENPRKKDGLKKVYSYTGTDLVGRFQYIIVNEKYENRPIHEIIEHLLRNYAPFVSIGHIQPSDFSVTITFKNKHLYTCLEQIAEIINFTFEMDFNQNFYWRGINDKDSLTPITDNDFKKGSASFSLSMEKFANRITVYGGNSLSENNIEDIITTDGLNNTYSLKYKPRTAISGKIEAYLNNVPLNLGTQNLHRFEEGFDILINANEKVVLFDTPPQAGKILKLIYRYEFPLVAILENIESIETYSIFEDVVTFPDITDRQTLRKRGEEHLKKYGTAPLFVGSLEPFYNKWNIGENVSVQIEELGVNHRLQITEKKTTIEPNILKVSLNFEQKTRTSDILKTIIKRIQELETSSQDEMVDKYQTVMDRFEVRDEVKNQNTIGFYVEETLLS